MVAAEANIYGVYLNVRGRDWGPSKLYVMSPFELQRILTLSWQLSKRALTGQTILICWLTY